MRVYSYIYLCKRLCKRKVIIKGSAPEEKNVLGASRALACMYIYRLHAHIKMRCMIEGGSKCADDRSIV